MKTTTAVLAGLAAFLATPFPSTPFQPQALKPRDGQPSAPRVQLLWADLDLDGRTDALALPPGGALQLLRNQGDDRFLDVTSLAGLADLKGFSGAQVLDYDLDSMPDLFLVGNSGSLRLFRQARGLTFSDVTLESGLPGDAAVQSVQFLDFDADGRVDLHLTANGQDRLFRNKEGQGFLEIELGLAPATAAAVSGIRRASDESPEAETREDAGAAPTEPGPSSGTGSSSMTSPGTFTKSSAGSASAASATLTCSSGVDDQASPGSCLPASSVPMIGALYPLSNDLYVDAGTGRVGLGTSSPTRRLTVDGGVRAANNGSQATVHIEQEGSGAIFVADSSGVERFRVRNLGGVRSIAEGTSLTDAALYGNNTSTENGHALFARSYGTGATAYITQLGSAAMLKCSDGTTERFIVKNAGGVYSVTEATGLSSAAVYAYNTSTSSGNAVYGRSSGTATTGYFKQEGTGAILKGHNGTEEVFIVSNTGRVTTTALKITGGGDLVEGFESSCPNLEPGSVAVIDPDAPGQLTTSTGAYDRRVAGVVSGANGINHGIRMGQDGVLDGDALLAMAGRVYVKCSAENGSIQPGDLLTTASLAGHAMKATDVEKSFGSVIGKAMGSLDQETGLVLVLVNLQ